MVRAPERTVVRFHLPPFGSLGNVIVFFGRYRKSHRSLLPGVYPRGGKQV